jgi:hypothetical protein
MDFLYSRNRLNVATSRARCIAIVATSPDLLRVRARTPAQMRLANALCRYVEMAAAEQQVTREAGQPPRASEDPGNPASAGPRAADTAAAPKVLTLGL